LGGAGRKRQRSSSRYTGVSWNKAQSVWRVRVTDLLTKRQKHVGYFASEEDAARAYDCAAMQAQGSGAKRNFPDEDISEAPATVGEQKTQRSSSRYTGVSWTKASSSWRVQLTDPQTKRKRTIGSYASEDDAARAYDCAAVQAHGPGAKHNFPGEAISEPPVALGEERKQRKSSRYVGVSWHKASSSWQVHLTDPQTKRVRHVGSFASEKDAARAYDCAAVQAHGPGANRNFPGEAISEPPAAVGEERKQRSSSRFIGVSWDKRSSSFRVRMMDPQLKKCLEGDSAVLHEGRRYIGNFVSEEDAARAYDCAVVQTHGPGAERNFPGEAISELPVTVGEERKRRRSS
jgi:hypothetical protein